MSELILTPGAVTLDELERVWRQGLAVRLHDGARAGIVASAERIAAAAAGDAPVYGVNTGFGKLASVRIAPADTATLQRNLILSHCCGVGEPIEEPTVRLIMALKLLSLGRGASGVRPVLVELIEAMLARGVTPVIPAQGSVGASGDLAPLAHLAAVMIGEGRATHGGREMAGADALAAAGLSPLTLAAKEGLALINGTQVSTRSRSRACSTASAPPARCWSRRPCPPTRSWGRPRRSWTRSTPCAAIAARSSPRARSARSCRGPRSAKATAPTTPACRTPIASAASRR